MASDHPIFSRSVYVRTHPKTKRALEHVVSDIEADGRLRFLAKAPTQEAVVNAMWLMLKDKDIDWIVAELGPYLERMENYADRDVTKSTIEVTTAPPSAEELERIRAELARRHPNARLQDDDDRPVGLGGVVLEDSSGDPLPKRARTRRKV